jgi:hypothetical protein
MREPSIVSASILPGVDLAFGLGGGACLAAADPVRTASTSMARATARAALGGGGCLMCRF